jgi:hypothetical protein
MEYGLERIRGRSDWVRNNIPQVDESVAVATLFFAGAWY